MSRRPMIILRGVILMLVVCSPLGAQTLGAGYQIARANQIDIRRASGPGLRLRFRVPIDLRYDYLITDGVELVVPVMVTDRSGTEVVHADITTWVTPRHR